MMYRYLALAALMFSSSQSVVGQNDGYRHFDAAVYARVYEVLQMADLDWLQQRFDVMNQHVRVSKVYLETHRDTILADDATLDRVKQFFADRGVRTAGGITLTINERNRFETFCYSDDDHRDWVRTVIEHTARHFDEIILDDFFFTSCKSAVEIGAKGSRSWTDYRLALLDEAARNLILRPARRVNPNVRVVVKYPNWYEHFQGLGFNLETQPALFDGIYTGNETRDAVRSAQHLQPYLSYQIFRYFENLKPGGNDGGWVDTGGMRSLDRYAEQLFLTLLARAPEITLFDFRQLQRPIRASDRGTWQGVQTSFDFDEIVGPYRLEDGSIDSTLTIARAAGYTLELADRVLGLLGQPTGIASYRPFHATGEDFLHNFIGMIGVPVDLRPDFPTDVGTILLTESAALDPDLVGKIKSQLVDGKNVVITSGLAYALQERGLRDIVEVNVSHRRALVSDYLVGWGQIVESSTQILIPQLEYLTNDSWELIGALDGPMGWPLLHDADYGAGHLYIWVIPDNFADLYRLPPQVLNRLRQVVMQHHYVRIEGPAEIALFTYDNDTFVVESFRDETVAVTIVANGSNVRLIDVLSDEFVAAIEAPGPIFRGPPPTTETAFSVQLKPHSFRVLRIEPVTGVLHGSVD